MITSYSDELPTDWSRSIRDQLKTEEYRTLFPNGAHVSKYDSSAKAWSTEEGGGVRAAGAGGSILGFGAHVAVVDDPVKGPEEADNPQVLKKLYDWATSTLYSRLAPGGGILIIQQRWSEEDLVGRFISAQEAEEAQVKELRLAAQKLRERENPRRDELEEADKYDEEATELEESMDRWEVITYPALATGDEYLRPDGAIVSLTADETPAGEWRLLRRKGDALHPERYGRSYYLKLKRNNPRRFAAMYQQSPIVDDGDYFSRSDFQTRYKVVERPELRFMNVFCAWDLAIGTLQSNDHTVGLTGGVDHEGRIWLLQRQRGRWGDLEQVADMVIDTHLRWGALQTGIERTHLEMALAPIIKRKLRERGTAISLAQGKEALKPISDKRIRARQFQALAKAGMVMVPEGGDWDEYIDWLVKFGATKVDDDVDASAWLAILSERFEPPKDPMDFGKEDERPWLEQFLDDYTHDHEAGEDMPFMWS
jgi:predicted phage terminase large subunit-like protein